MFADQTAGCRTLIRFARCAALAGVLAATAATTLAEGQRCVDTFLLSGGSVQLRLDRAELLDNGIVADGAAPLVDAGRVIQTAEFVLSSDGLFGISVAGDQVARLLGGEIDADGALSLQVGDTHIDATTLTLSHTASGGESSFGLIDTSSGRRLFEITGINSEFDDAALELRMSAYLWFSDEAPGANEDGSPRFAGEMRMRASVEPSDVNPREFFPPSEPAPGDDIILGGFPSRGADVTVCVLPATQQFGRSGAVGSGKVGLAVGTTSANKGDTQLNWHAMPDTRHPVIAQNLYRMQTVDGSVRFEQLGQSWLKHGFCALQLSGCFSCTPAGGGCESRLGVGCADPYSVSLNASQGGLGARSWVHPFKGSFSSGANNHAGHSHNGISHRVQVLDAELMNRGDARFFSEGQYVSADDSAAGNQFNNASYREVRVSGPNGSGTFSFSNVGSTQRETSAIRAWNSATQVLFTPLSTDGIATLAYEVTDLGDGTWHYEYAIYNMNFSEAFNSFNIPVPAGVTVSNGDFHYVRNHGVQVTGSTFENVAWNMTEGGGAVNWSTDNEATNVNANALRWGTLFNFRFDADTPPQPADATIGLYRSGGSTTVATVGPSPGGAPCVSDLNGDGAVDLGDLATLLANFGVTSGATFAEGDVTGDGAVGLEDLSILLSEFGSTCP